MGFGMGREQAERSVPAGTDGPWHGRVSSGRAGWSLAGRAVPWGCQRGMPVHPPGRCAAPSGSVSPLRAQGALHLGGLQQGLALLQLKPLELKRGCCCRDTS